MPEFAGPAPFFCAEVGAAHKYGAIGTIEGMLKHFGQNAVPQ